MITNGTYLLQLLACGQCTSCVLKSYKMKENRISAGHGPCSTTCELCCDFCSLDQPSHNPSIGANRKQQPTGGGTDTCHSRAGSTNSDGSCASASHLLHHPLSAGIGRSDSMALPVSSGLVLPSGGVGPRGAGQGPPLTSIDVQLGQILTSAFSHTPRLVTPVRIPGYRQVAVHMPVSCPLACDNGKETACICQGLHITRMWLGRK